jgi:hypothetical protein
VSYLEGGARRGRHDVYKQFQFEGDVHQSLDCVPLSVRRRLDLAALKISLAGWQALSRAERLALCHLPTESDADLVVYREVMQAFCAARGVALKPLADSPRTWNAPEPPAELRARLEQLGVPLSADAWRALDEEGRYALVKLADPQREPAKLHAALVELGLASGPAAVDPAAASCTRPEDG